MVRRLAACVILATITLAAPVPAAAADSTAAAAAHYKQGRKLYQVAEYARALDEFKAAYLARDDPAFLYNIAQCHRQLGDNRQALTFFKRYLADAPANVANRAEAENMVKDLEAKLAAAPSPVPPAPPPAEAPPATPPAPAPTPTLTASPPPASSPAGRSGWHVQLALGGGGMRDDFDWGNGLINGNATGGSVAGQVAVAYGVMPRLAIGGLIAGESVQSPNIRIADQPSNTVDVGALGFIGAFADFRLATDRATGAHFQAALGGARMSITDRGGGVSNHSPAGGGIVLGAGYDWRLADNWQWGVLGRLMAVTLGDEGVTHRLGALSVLLSASYR